MACWVQRDRYSLLLVFTALAARDEHAGVLVLATFDHAVVGIGVKRPMGTDQGS